MSEKSIVGDLLNFRGLVYAPMNENGVIFLFGKVADDLNMYIEEIKPGYPDCIGRRFIGKGWERVRIEFEFKSSNFKLHKHDPKDCDLIICWENDWKDCPLEVIELKTEIRGLNNNLVPRPDEINNLPDNDLALENLFNNVNSNENVKIWYKQIYNVITDYNANIWAKIGTKYCGWYSPKKSFVSVKPSSQTIGFSFYTGKEGIEGSIIGNKKFAPNWSKYSVKKDSDIDIITKMLIESHKRIEHAISTGKATALFSDGEKFGASKEIMDSEEDNE